MGVSAIDLHMYAAAVNKQSLSSDRGLSLSLSHTLSLSVVSPVCSPLFPCCYRLQLSPEVGICLESHLRRKEVGCCD